MKTLPKNLTSHTSVECYCIICGHVQKKPWSEWIRRKTSNRENHNYCMKCATKKYVYCGNEFDLSFKKGRDINRDCCWECVPSTTDDALRNRYRTKKNIEKIKQEFGDECLRCGYNEFFSGIDFHHLDTSSKESTPAKLLPNQWSCIEKEYQKCIPLCKCCHSALHYGEERWDIKDIEDKVRLYFEKPYLKK